MTKIEYSLRSATGADAPNVAALVDAASGNPRLPVSLSQTAAPESADAEASLLLGEPLSGREVEVLTLLASGRSNREIARELLVAVGTIKTHTNNIYGKLGAKNRAETLARARMAGLLK